MKAKLKSKLPKKLATLKPKLPSAPKMTAAGRPTSKVFYAVTIFVARIGNKEEMIKYYKLNRCPITFFPNEKPWREEQDRMMVKAFGKS